MPAPAPALASGTAAAPLALLLRRCCVLCCLLHHWTPSHALTGAPPACETEWDCSLAGTCSAAGECACDPGWQGPTCARLAFKPAPAVGHAFRPGAGFTTWGGSPIQADNRSMYYLFASVNLQGTVLHAIAGGGPLLSSAS